MTQSVLRRLKREAKKKAKLTFAERVFNSIRTGKPLTRVEYETVSQRELKAKEVA